jgi:hypothetical protein
MFEQQGEVIASELAGPFAGWRDAAGRHRNTNPFGNR